MGALRVIDITKGRGAWRYRAMQAGRVVLAGLALLAVPAVRAQLSTDGATVSWSASPAAEAKTKRGGRVVLTLRGQVREGWHVYGLKQLETGPTPLLVSLDQTALAKPGGAPVGSTPTVARDEAFGFDTPYYTGNFSIVLPVRLAARAPAGRQVIPVSIRFQTCNGRTCQPPKSVRLSVPVDIEAGA